jgi:heat shock protein HslJ
MKTIVKKTALLLSSIVVLALSSCNKQDSVSPPPSSMRQTASAINNSKWEFSNYTINKVTLKQEQQATIAFSNFVNNKIDVAGKSFLNFYGGTVTIDDVKGILTYSSGLTSLMAGDDTTMKLELDFIRNLEKSTYFEIQNSQLIIYLGDKNNSKTEKMVFFKK